ncbi:MAG: DNA polymerase Y family protein [Deltaproteobacteria bacterium]|nr:DNA polymerase Y family protein [Deltaproteobacteria bacterium]
MPRIACLWVPEMLLAAHLRFEPELAETPLALTEGEAARQRILAVSRRAREAGVEAGMSVAQARARYAPLVVRRIVDAAVASAAAALADVARTVGPRIESNGRDRVFLECEGTRTLAGAEPSLATALAARAARCGVPAWVGIADAKLAAYLAAREGGGVCILPPGGARAFMAPLPVDLLEPDPATASTLVDWGIRTIGDLLALPSGALAHRLGARGAALVRRARGEDAPFVPQEPPAVFEERMELEYAVDHLEPLMFVLHRLLACVTARMAVSGVGCRELDLLVGFEDGGQERRNVPVAAPTVDAKTLLTLARTHLESRPPRRAVGRLRVAGVAARMRPTQLDFLEPVGPAPAALAATLARLAALCGPERVGVLRPVDSHRPGAVKVEVFGGAVSRPSSTAAVAAADVPLRIVRLALRAFRPAVDVEVLGAPGSLAYVRGSGFGGRVVRWAGPWRLRGDWWTSEPYAREYYDVALSDGGVYRVYRDARSGRWSTDGVYD